MSDPTCVDSSDTIPGTSSIQIDPGAALTFLMNDLFIFQDQTPIQASILNRAYSGALHANLRYFKDQFTILFPKLTEAQQETLKQLVQQTGVNAFHTLIYRTVGIVRQYDGVTLPGYNVNQDVNRLRKKVYFNRMEFPHLDQIANTYRCVLVCEET